MHLVYNEFKKTTPMMLWMRLVLNLILNIIVIQSNNSCFAYIKYIHIYIYAPRAMQQNIILVVIGRKQ